MKTIDFYYAARGKSKDADMARALGITTAAIAQAKKREHLSAYHAAKCAAIAGLSVEKAMIAAAIEAEHDEKKQKELADMLSSSYNPSPLESQRGALAQLVEQRTLNP